MKSKKQIITTVLEYALMLSVVLYSSMWAQFTGALSNTFSRIFILILGALLLINYDKITARAIYKASALVLFLSVFLFFTRYNFIRTILYLIIPFALCFLYFSTKKTGEEKSNFFLYLSDIIVVFSLVSLILYFFGTILNVIPETAQVRVWWAEEEKLITHYLHLLYEAQDITFFGHHFMRNCSIFPEAPAFAAYIAVSFGAEMFLRKKISLYRVVILILATVTSFSAKALLLVAAALLLKFLFWNKKGVGVAIFKALAVIISLGFAAIVLIDKAKSHSFFIRLDDFYACLEAFKTSPIFGTGYYNDSSVITHFEYAYRYNDGLSMGLAVLLAQGGLWLFMFYILSAVKAVFAAKKEQRSAILSFALIFLGMLFITNAPFSMMTIFAVSFFANSGEKGFTERLWKGVKKPFCKA